MKNILLYVFFIFISEQAHAKKTGFALLKQESFLYNLPLLASGPTQSLSSPIKSGESVSILHLEDNSEWMYVQYDSNSGWILKDWLEIVEIKEVEPLNISKPYIQKKSFPMQNTTTLLPWNENEDWADKLLLEKLN